MNLRNVIDTHPVFVLVSVGVAAATFGGGSVQYYASQALELEKARCQLEKARFQNEISERDRELRSIERGLDTENRLLDVRSLIITRDEVDTLEREFLPFSDGRFYVAVPEEEEHEWTY